MGIQGIEGGDEGTEEYMNSGGVVAGLTAGMGVFGSTCREQF